MKKTFLILLSLWFIAANAQIKTTVPDTAVYKIDASETKTSKLLSPLSLPVLVVVDSKIWGTLRNTVHLDSIVPVEKIKSLNVLKGKAAIDKYGANGTNGVVEINTGVLPEEVPVDYEALFENPEVVASFPGGDKAWFKFLEQNANASIASDKGAPAGTYRAEAEFVVDKQGKLSGFKALTRFGYGME